MTVLRDKTNTIIMVAVVVGLSFCFVTSASAAKNDDKDDKQRNIERSEPVIYFEVVTEPTPTPTVPDTSSNPSNSTSTQADSTQAENPATATATTGTSTSTTPTTISQITPVTPDEPTPVKTSKPSAIPPVLNTSNNSPKPSKNITSTEATATTLSSINDSTQTTAAPSIGSMSLPNNYYAYDSFSPTTTRTLLMYAFLLSIFGVILFSDTLRRFFVEFAQTLGRGFSQELFLGKIKKKNYEGQQN